MGTKGTHCRWGYVGSKYGIKVLCTLYTWVGALLAGAVHLVWLGMLLTGAARADVGSSVFPMLAGTPLVAACILHKLITGASMPSSLEPWI